MNTKETPIVAVTLPTEAQDAIKYITSVCVNYQNQIDNLKKENEFFQNFQPAKALLPYKGVARDNNPSAVYWEKFDPKHLNISHWNRNSDTPTFIKNNWTIDRINTLLIEDEKIAIQNDIIAAENTEKYNRVFEFLKRIGLQETDRVYKTKRSFKTITVTRSWVDEVSRMFPRNHGWSSLKDSYEKAIKHITEYEQDKFKYQDVLKSKVAAEQKIKANVVLLVELNLKYKLGLDSTLLNKSEVLNQLIEQNKYLYLAHYLMKNRGDWNDGYSYAETGLRYFTAFSQTANDEVIVEEIEGYIENWDGDGRIFRDCIHGYDYLFNLVNTSNPELYADYRKLSELIENDGGNVE